MRVGSRPGNYVQNPIIHPIHPLISEIGLDNLVVGLILDWVIKIQIYFGWIGYLCWVPITQLPLSFDRDVKLVLILLSSLVCANYKYYYPDFWLASNLTLKRIKVFLE